MSVLNETTGVSLRRPASLEDTSLMSVPLAIQLAVVGQTSAVENQNQLYT